jgi:hypothetical protein
VPVLRASLPEPLYLRSFIYGSYQGGAWQSRNVLAMGGGNFAQAFTLERSKNRHAAPFRIEPLVLPGGSVPIPGEIARANLRSAGYAYNAGGSLTLRDDPPYPPVEGEVRIYDGTEPLSNTDTQIAELMPEYLQTSGTAPNVAALARDVTRNAKSDYEMAMAIKAAIESRARYNLDAPATPDGKDPVSYFLFDSKEGYCDLFASSMTLMARSVGLPARYVVGYYPFEESKDSRGRYIVRQKDAHAWCEIFFDNAGWVVFDATEGAASVEGGERGGTGSLPFWRSPWVLGAFGGIALAVGLWFAVRSMLAYLAFRRSPAFAALTAARAMARQRARVGRVYSSFERELRKTVKRPRGFAETIMEYAAVALPKLGARADSASRLSRAFASAMYATPEVDDTHLAQLRDSVRDFRRARGRTPA